jgi:hypothetical protein
VSPPACCACVWRVRTALVRRGGRPAADPELVRRELTGTDRRGGFIVNHRSKLELATDMPDVLIRRLVIAIGAYYLSSDAREVAQMNEVADSSAADNTRSGGLATSADGPVSPPAQVCGPDAPAAPGPRK